MRKISLYLTTLALLLSVSCSGDIDTALSPDTETGADGCYTAGFTITLDSDQAEARSISRAPADGKYEPGSAAENYINIPAKDFRVYIFDSNDSYVATLQDVVIDVIDASGLMKRYQVNGTLPKQAVDAAGTNLKVLMLANWRGSYPQPVAGTKIEDIAASASAAYTFDYSADQTIDDDHAIPMYGVSNLLMDVKFSKEWNTDLGTLHMLRAYAKIRVRAAESSLPLESVVLTRGNLSGLRAPLGVTYQDQYVHGSYALDYYRLPSIPASPQVQTDIPFTAPATTGGDWILYLPEFANLNLDSTGTPNPRDPLAPEQRARLCVMFEGYSLPIYVDFKYYSEPPSYADESAEKDDHFDILRNTVYDYTLNKLYGDTELQVEVDIQPYAEQKLSPDFGIMRDEQGDIMIVPETDENGTRKLPDYFLSYLASTGKTLPFPLTDLVDGDYYAIHLLPDGELRDAEVWLKDIDGAHVLENFSPRDDNDQNCSTRYVELYFGLDKYYFHKDRDGDRRLHHFTNHWTIVLDRKDYTIFKSPDNKERYEIASWDESDSSEFFIFAEPKSDDDYYYYFKVTDGVVDFSEKLKVEKPEEPEEVSETESND